MIEVTKKQKGFTLIEMIVSLGIFSIVVTTAVGALLIIMSTNQQLQAEQNVMTNLAFALDSMTREVRTGYSYVCGSASIISGSIGGGPNRKIFDTGTDHDSMGTSTTKDCVDGNNSNHNYQGISFFEGGNSISGSANRIMYYFDQNDTANKKIMRRVGNNTAQSILSSGIELLDVEFFVSGADAWGGFGGDLEQPTVTIYIEAKARDNNPNSNSYALQTTITQRTFDL
jgi:prepilin-type N-terminal cleavage/methylation domain-containing protein